MSERTKNLLAALMMAGALVSLLCFGILGIGREDVFNLDGQVLYAAGRAWMKGGNPYDFASLSRSVADVPGISLGTAGFFYPPQSAGLFVPMGLLPYGLARVVWLMINMLSIAGIVAMTMSVMRKRAGIKMDAWRLWVLAAVIIGNPFTSRVIWMGQTSLVAFAATLGIWFFASRKSWVLAGICLGLASFKPQICVLVIIWMLLEWDWKTLIVGAVTAVTLALYPMAVQGGPVGALTAWLAGLNADYINEFNQPSWPHKIGMQSVLSDLNVFSQNSVFLWISLISALVLWRVRNRIAKHDVLALLVVSTLTFSTYLHDYDYVILAPVFASLWWYAGESGMATAIAGSLPLLAFIPQRLILALGYYKVFEQWRTGVVIVMGVAILAYSASSMTREGRSRVSEAGA